MSEGVMGRRIAWKAVAKILAMECVIHGAYAGASEEERDQAAAEFLNDACDEWWSQPEGPSR